MTAAGAGRSGGTGTSGGTEMGTHRKVVAAVALALLIAGCTQEAPPPADRATIPAVQAPATITRNVPFTVDVYGEDLGSGQYAIIHRVDQAPAGLESHGTRCNGPDGEFNGDGNWCEYGSSPLAVTRSVYRFVWTGGKGTHVSLRFCASSFTNPPVPYPYGGVCVNKTVAVAP